MNKIKIVAAFLAITWMGAWVLEAQPSGPMFDRPPGDGFFLAYQGLFDGRAVLKNKQAIDLSATQEKKIEALVLAFEESLIRKGAEIKINELKFALYIKADKVDRKEIARLITEISRQKTDSIIAYLDYLLDVREMLTGRQREKLKKLIPKRPRGGPGPGMPEIG